MHFLGLRLSRPRLSHVLAAASATALFAAVPASAQNSAPQVLPYTMSTFAGPHAAYTIGQACGNYIALDTIGDGCPAPLVEVGIDPHDVRVDGQGNVFYVDDGGSYAIVHKIAAATGRQTVYAGTNVNSKGPCSTAGDTIGSGCIASDGGANVTNNANSYRIPKSRGLAVAPNGDIYIATYNGDTILRIGAADGYLRTVAGTLSTAGFVDAAYPNKSLLSGVRGVGVDAVGNVYIADTANNVIRVAQPLPQPNPLPPTGPIYIDLYTTGTLTALDGASGSGVGGCVNNTLGTTAGTVKVIQSGVPASQAQVCAPEDVQVDSNGNIYIADAGDNLVRAIYSGKGSLPGIIAPIAGYIYTIAGVNTTNGTIATSYPKDGTTPTFPATTIAITVRKISLDANNNLYIADSGSNVVWFVDNATGNIRILAGSYGLVQPANSYCYTNGKTTSTIGDGCPASTASIYSASNMGTAPDNQGNLYITDTEAVATSARIRKVLSNLDFPATNRGASVTQTVLIHFGPLDTLAAASGFSINGTPGMSADFTLGTPTITTNTDTTTDYYLPVTFTPTRPGNDTATLVIRSTLGTTSSYLLIGTGVTSSIAIDPGSVTLQNGTVKTPVGIAVDGAGNIYAADTGNNRVLITSALTGTTTTFAGTGTAGNTGDTGLATAATLNAPRAVTVDTAGNVYIADTGNNRIRRVGVTGVISAYAGGGTACATAFNALGDGCPATQATLSAPAGLVADNLGSLFVSDTGHNLIRQITDQGYIIPFAGGASSICSANTDSFGDGCSASQVNFNGPAGLAYDATNKNLIVADTGNNLVRSVYLANTITGTAAVYTVLYNPVTLVAGNGTAGSTVDTNNTAALSELSGPTGVAVGAAGSVYIADTGNNAIRLVTPSGSISTIVGLLGATAGTGTVPGTAANVQLTAPSGVAVTQNGTLYIADTTNNRILTDQRSQIAYQFGRTNVGFSSPTQTFFETNIGTASATLPTPLLTNTPAQTQFTLVSPTTGGCVSGSFAVGASCTLVAQFTPTATGTPSTTFVETGTNTAAGDPSFTFIGVGAVLTQTNSTVAQSTPATGSAQFGGQFAVTATVTPVSCNAAAPSCAPTGTVRFSVDGGNPGSPVTVTPNATVTASTASQTINGLAVGVHIISCNYSGDNFYAASTCGNTNITITAATTTALLSATNNNSPQFLATNCQPDQAPATKGDPICTVTTLKATVVSSGTAGTPNGNVVFTATGGPLGATVRTLGTASLDATGVATFNVNYERDLSYNIIYDNTLLPGTYQLGCSFSSQSPNFGPSTCTPITFTVAPQTVDFSLQVSGCAANTLVPAGFLNPSAGVACAQVNTYNGAPLVATAQGSTADATIFILANNTLSGKLTFACSGLPTNSICTFQPTSLTLASNLNFDAPQAVDMTLWTDIPPGNITSSLRTPASAQHQGAVSLAGLLGWPLTALGLLAVVRFRRRSGNVRGLALLGLMLSIVGATSAMTGCGSGGPGAYNPSLTPAGTYPITVTVTGDGVTHSAVVYWKVTAPGIPGQE